MRSFIQAAILAFLATMTALVIPAQSQGLGGGQRRELVRACRADMARLCQGAKPGGGAIMRCLKERETELSDACRSAISGSRSSGKRLNRRQGNEGQADLAAGSKTYRDIAYGNHPLQKLDIYVPEGAANAPVILMVHGGGWRNGSKSSPRVVDNKVAYWLPKGYIFISVGNRLLPDADPLEQAQDVARAIAAAQNRVRSLGGDPRRFVLMGHSAGAHLVTLLSADPGMAARFGAKPWRGTVALDSAAYDVVEIMQGQHPKLYDDAFGTDRQFWRQASPIARLNANAPPMMLVCSSQRRQSCAQARDFDKKARSLGVRIDVSPVAKSHGAINADLGKPGAYTRSVDNFIQRLVR